MEIVEEKKRLRENFEKGTTCKCCGQFVKLYKRKMNFVMIKCLLRLSRHKEDNYIHVYDIVKGISNTGTNDFSKLAYWGLIAEMDKTSDKTRTSGFWKITRKGRDFVERKMKLPEYAFVYNGKPQGFSEDLIYIEEALKNKFSYSELMGLDI